MDWLQIGGVGIVAVMVFTILGLLVNAVKKKNTFAERIKWLNKVINDKDNIINLQGELLSMGLTSVDDMFAELQKRHPGIEDDPALSASALRAFSNADVDSGGGAAGDSGKAET